MNIFALLFFGLKFRQYIVRAINWRRMRWAVHVAHMGEMRNVYTV